MEMKINGSQTTKSSDSDVSDIEQVETTNHAERNDISYRPGANFTKHLNASSVIRTVADYKKKWQDVKSVTKKKEATRVTATRVTGGGPPPVCSFKPWETNVSVKTLTRTQVEGIEGGVDTLEPCGLTSSTTCIAEVHMANSPEDEAVCDIEEAFVPQENSSLEKDIGI
ncbi:unnamed protein product [Mytilus edulis]|uniref:Uncharacterized protein n=1 Tax=Mytilus edulis TaxID=6550 RepID=A0A8S3S9X8_MYTED|nr:unnamed protein product [Mytilus edulis]